MKLKLFFMMVLLTILSACGDAVSNEPAAPAESENVQEETVAEEPSATPAPPPTSTVESADPAGSTENEISMEDAVTTDSGLQYIVVEEGTGATPQTGELVQVHYTGTLENGTKFDSSYDRGEPIQFPLGVGQVIPGWDEGISLMNVGGRAKLIIPSDLAYGERGAGGVIPPNATLLFDVELVSIQEGPPGAPTKVDAADYTTTDSGLQYYDFEVGSGPSPTTSGNVSVHYTGWLEDGTMFDSSLSRGQPFDFAIGVGQVIPGWDEGVASMKVGGKRQLRIPAALAYGDRGAGGLIPPGATLIFEVELLGVQ